MSPLIIGAGPVGSNIARLLESLNPVLIESRKRVGLPVHCTGLVSTRLQELTSYPDSLVLNKITGASFFSKSERVTLDAGRVMAHVIDRAGFDDWMFKRYSGVSRLGEKFVSYSNGVAVTSKGEYNTDLVIDCSGAKNGLLGLQAVVPLKRESSLVELYFDVVPDFFAWVVPCGNAGLSAGQKANGVSLCRVGLATKGNGMPVLKSFLNKLGAGKPREWNAGLIPLSVNDFVSDNIVRCGDAAGQVKAVSGGGLVTGLLSSEILSRAVLNAGGDYSRDYFVKSYVKPWKRSVGRELMLHARARKYLDSCNYDELLRFIKSNKDTFERFGDMDFLSSLAFKLLKPGNLGFILKSLFSVLS